MSNLPISIIFSISFISLAVTIYGKFEPRIIGGEPADDAGFISVIMGTYQITGKLERLCLGTILNEFSILTPAKCAHRCGIKPSHCRAYIGVFYSNTLEGQQVKIVGGAVHDSFPTPDYFINTFQIIDDKINKTFVDIGILYVEKIPLSDNITSIEVSNRPINSSDTVTAYGFGVRQHFKHILFFH